ncbi:hypothetical protein SK128_022461 [Halocaridina rubra]|uniref:Sushi domain-containing protein n=1 Tax=Halocaridina rubra TaxID=373956 RepID=A0AAN8WST3_HALRR
MGMEAPAEVARLTLCEMFHICPTHLINGGDWTQGGLYNVSADVINMADGSLPHYALHVPATIAESLTLAAFPMTKSDFTVTLCQFPGIAKCLAQPPAPLASMTQTWDNSTDVGTEIIYRCSPGFFVNSTITETEQTVTCLGQLGEWDPADLQPCVAVEVCNDTELPVYEGVVVTKSVTPLYVNGSINYTCPAGMTTATGLELQTTLCSNDSSSPNLYSYLPLLLPCDTTTLPPVVMDATTDWVENTSYTINDTLTVTCNENTVLDLENTTQTIILTASGWSTVIPCYNACTTAPPVAGTEMTRDNLTSNAFGATLTYTCSAGFSFPTSINYPTVSSSRTITCENYTWSPDDYDVTACVKCKWIYFYADI